MDQALVDVEQHLKSLLQKKRNNEEEKKQIWQDHNVIVSDTYGIPLKHTLQLDVAQQTEIMQNIMFDQHKPLTLVPVYHCPLCQKSLSVDQDQNTYVCKYDGSVYYFGPMHRLPYEYDNHVDYRDKTHVSPSAPCLSTFLDQFTEQTNRDLAFWKPYVQQLKELWTKGTVHKDSLPSLSAVDFLCHHKELKHVCLPFSTLLFLLLHGSKVPHINETQRAELLQLYTKHITRCKIKDIEALWRWVTKQGKKLYGEDFC